MQTSLVEFLTETDIESAMYKMAATFGDKVNQIKVKTLFNILL